MIAWMICKPLRRVGALVRRELYLRVKTAFGSAVRKRKIVSSDDVASVNSQQGLIWLLRY